MDKSKLATAIIGGVGLSYTTAVVLNPEIKKDCEDYIENTAEAIGNIPLTVMEDFNLLTESGDYTTTESGDRILGSKKTSYGIDLQSRPEIAIISTIEGS